MAIPSKINELTIVYGMHSKRNKKYKKKIDALKKNSKIDDLIERISFLKQSDNFRKKMIAILILMQTQNSNPKFWRKTDKIVVKYF